MLRSMINHIYDLFIDPFIVGRYVLLVTFTISTKCFGHIILFIISSFLDRWYISIFRITHLFFGTYTNSYRDFFNLTIVILKSQTRLYLKS